MSQLNLKQILSSDNLSIVTEKINYNFDQLVLNGGGPQGLRGILGSPGLPGQQGLQGGTGPTGEDGTHTFVDTVGPTVYPFGTGGEILPRISDVFLEAGPTYIRIWQLSATGASSSYWKFIDEVTAPGGAFGKVVFDQIAGPTMTEWNSAANDPSIVGKVLVGSVNALYATGATGLLTVIDPAFPINTGAPRLVTELSSISSSFNNSLLTLASDSNQLRILSSDSLNSTRLLEGGGIVHSLQYDSAGGATHQAYKIINADVNGLKDFVISLNNGPGILPTLFYADTNHRLGHGVAEYTNLLASFTTNASIAVGRISSGFYLAASGATVANGMGAIIEGNLAIGKNRNNIATGGFYNNLNNPLGGSAGYGASIKIDTDGSPIFSTSVAELYFGKAMYPKAITSFGQHDFWRFRHDSYSNVSNPGYRKFTLLGVNEDPFGFLGTRHYERTVITARLEKLAPSTTRSVVGIDNTNPTAMFEVGQEELPWARISLGNASTTNPSAGYISSYLGFNMMRNPILDSWTRGSNGFQNTGRAIWTAPYGGLNISFMQNSGGSTVSGMTDQNVHDNTRLYIEQDGRTTISELNVANTFGWVDAALTLDYGGSGFSGYGPTGYRRGVAVLGKGVSTGIEGSPMIFAHNGINQNTSILLGPDVLPQYTFFGNDSAGLYLSEGSTANNIFSPVMSTGLCISGNAAVTVTDATILSALFPGYVTGLTRVGIVTRNPLEKMQIGDLWTFHDGGVKIMGYNRYYDGIDTQRIQGNQSFSPFDAGGTWRGTATIGFDDATMFYQFPQVPTDYLTGYSNKGGIVWSTVTPPSYVGIPVGPDEDPNNINTYRGWKMSHGAIGPAGYVNQAPYVPQLRLGLSFESDPSGTTLKRGTLSIASQLRGKPFGSGLIEDAYNIGLYSYTGTPQASIGVSITPATDKTIVLSLLTDSGAWIGDQKMLTLKSLDPTLNDFTKRVAFFGNGGGNVRVGIGVDIATVAPIGLPTNHSLIVYPTGGAGRAAYFGGRVDVVGDIYNTGNTRVTGIVRADNDFTTGTDTPGWVTYLLPGTGMASYKPGSSWTNVNLPFTGTTTFGKAAILYKIIGKTVHLQYWVNNFNNNQPGFADRFVILLPPALQNIRDYNNYPANPGVGAGGESVSWYDNGLGKRVMCRNALRRYVSGFAGSVLYYNTQWVLTIDGFLQVIGGAANSNPVFDNNPSGPPGNPVGYNEQVRGYMTFELI